MECIVYCIVYIVYAGVTGLAGAAVGACVALPGTPPSAAGWVAPPARSPAARCHVPSAIARSCRGSRHCH